MVMCVGKCLLNKLEYEHLEMRHVNCSVCTCNDSAMTCKEDKCETLTCANQKNQTGSCCPVCEGDEPNTVKRKRHSHLRPGRGAGGQ